MRLLLSLFLLSAACAPDIPTLTPDGTGEIDGKSDRVVTTHRLVNGGLLEGTLPQTIQSEVQVDGGLYGTAPDYTRFLQMLLNLGAAENGTQLLSKATVQEMTRNQIGELRVETQSTTNPAVSLDFPIGAGTDTFGLGVQITGSSAATRDLRAQGSYSRAGIFNTHFWGDPERGVVAVIPMQQLPFYDEDAMAVDQGFEERVNRYLR